MLRYLRSLEKKLEGLIEGKIMDTIDDRIHPLEIAKKLSKGMRDEKKACPGGIYAPNFYTIALSPEDHGHFGNMAASFEKELVQFLIIEAEELDFQFLGSTKVHIESDERLKRGELVIDCLFTSPPPGAGPDSEELHRNNIVRGLFWIREGFGKGNVLALRDGMVTIGRNDENDVPIGDPKVSATHCTVEWKGNEALLRDRGSTNGMMVNGKKLDEAALSEKDEITLGYTTIQFFKMH
jgi:hypothetical protein